MTESEKRRHRVCFTGHRPEKLTRPEAEIKRALKKAIRQAADEEMTVFISGMARGADIWAAEQVLKLRDAGYPLKLICACPYEGFEAAWSLDWQQRYHAVLAAADLVRYISLAYRRDCFQRRNRWMVDHATRVIAVYNGTASGTRNTIAYARQAGVPVVTIDG